MSRIQGYRAFRWEGRNGATRRGHSRASSRETRYWMLGPTWAVLFSWRPHRGMWAFQLYRNGPRGEVVHQTERTELPMGLKKRQALGLDSTPIPALPTETKLWAALPQLVEFIVATAYEDGSPRVPGTVQLETKAICFALTLRDPDSGMRLQIQAPTLDDVLKGANKLLGAPDAPWEVDRYLTEQLAKKKPKKK